MNSNSDVIKIFCCRLAVKEGIQPLETKEWGDLCSLMIDKGVQPSDLAEYSEKDFKWVLGVSEEYAARLSALTKRKDLLFSEISECENSGITVLTRADGEYPQKLKKTLGNSCPPILYCAGDMRLLTGKSAGFAGSRKAGEEDEIFTRATVRKTAQKGYAVVSGGARGVDSFAESEGLKIGCGVIEFPSEGIMRRMRSATVERAVQDGGMALLSSALPYAPFSAAYAIMRNRFIYAQSSGTVVVRSDLERGGSWAGATDNLRHGFCTEFCWNNAEYAGNTELIKRGAIPIDDTFDGDLEAYAPPLSDKQISMF